MSQIQPPTLEVASLSKRYGSLTAAHDINFVIHPGQILGVLGPNGAGKSTVVKMITGLVQPSSGAILFKGRHVGDDFGEYKRAFGYVPEQSDLYGFLTGWEYLDMVATLRGLDRRMFRERASTMLNAFTLFRNRDLPISSYSKGMRQRIAVISALLHDPELLILDEPFSGLDVTSALVLRRVIGLLAERQKAIFFSSPVLEQADKLCTHLVVLRRGSVVASGSMDEVHEGFDGLDLEAGFMRLTEQVDVDHVARNIVTAIAAKIG
jgi:ABC-2 type transport system ATP-binding protein